MKVPGLVPGKKWCSVIAGFIPSFFICLTWLMWRLNAIMGDGLGSHSHVGCYKKKKENVRNKEFKEQGPTHRAHQGPDICDRFKSLAISSRSHNCALYVGLSENSREINGKNAKIIDCTTQSINKYLLNTYQPLSLKLRIKQWTNGKFLPKISLCFSGEIQTKYLNEHRKYYNGEKQSRKGLGKVGVCDF